MASGPERLEPVCQQLPERKKKEEGRKKRIGSAPPIDPTRITRMLSSFFSVALLSSATAHLLLSVSPFSSFVCLFGVRMHFHNPLSRQDGGRTPDDLKDVAP